MNKGKIRIPLKGDRVTAVGYTGEFLIYGIDAGVESAELKQVGKDFALSSIPWRDLKFLNEKADKPSTAPAARKLPGRAT